MWLIACLIIFFLLMVWLSTKKSLKLRWLLLVSFFTTSPCWNDDFSSAFLNPFSKIFHQVWLTIFNCFCLFVSYMLYPFIGTVYATVFCQVYQLFCCHLVVVCCCCEVKFILKKNILFNINSLWTNNYLVDTVYFLVALFFKSHYFQRYNRLVLCAGW